MSIEPGAAGIGLGELVPRDRLDGTLATDLPALVEIEWTLWFDQYGTGTDLYVLGARNGGHPENLAQLEAVGEECLVGFPLRSAQ